MQNKIIFKAVSLVSSGNPAIIWCDSSCHEYMPGFRTVAWGGGGGGGESIGASTKSGNVRGYLTICTDFSIIIIKFLGGENSTLRGGRGGESQFPPLYETLHA